MFHSKFKNSLQDPPIHITSKADKDDCIIETIKWLRHHNLCTELETDEIITDSLFLRDFYLLVMSPKEVYIEEEVKQKK